MKVIKIIWSIYVWIIAGSLFVIELLLMIFWSFIFKHKTWDPWFKAMLKIMFKIAFVRIEIEGSEHIDKKKAYLFMPNHVSLLDIPLVAAFIPVFIRGVEAHHHFKWPIYGWATKRYGNIPINRQKIGKSMKSLEAAGKYLSEKKSVIIFPEGHRTKNGRLLKFKKLPFFLAKQVGVEIIPMGISGMHKLHPYGSFTLDLRSKLKIKFDAPIPLSIIMEKNPEDLSILTQEKVEKLIEKP